MDKVTLGKLSADLKAMKGTYREHKTVCEASIAERRWATGRYYSLLPFQEDRAKSVRGRKLAGAPKSAKNVVEFGFDADKRLVLVRSIGPDGKAASEQFIEYLQDDALVARVYLRGGKSPGKVARVRMEGGAPLEMAELGSAGDWAHERYRYAHGRVMAIDVERYHGLTKQTIKHQIEIQYDSKGGGTGLRIDEDGSRKESFVFEPAQPA